MAADDKLARWKADSVAFIEGVLIDPETGRQFALYPAQEAFLRKAFELTPDGRLAHSEQLFSAAMALASFGHPRQGGGPEKCAYVKNELRFDAAIGSMLRFCRAFRPLLKHGSTMPGPTGRTEGA